jgi:hypothetical protein
MGAFRMISGGYLILMTLPLATMDRDVQLQLDVAA